MDFNTHMLPLIMPIFKWIMWFIPVLLLISALKMLFTSKLRGIEGEWLVKKNLDRLGLESLNDVFLSDNNNGLTQIDHIVLLPDSIMVIETKNYNGVLLGRENDKQWTHKIGRQTHYPQNPLRQNHLHINAVKALNLGVPVEGLVVFTNNAKFPKGLPRGVIQLKDLKRELKAQLSLSVPSQHLMMAWQKLKRAVRTDKNSRKQHMDNINKKYGKSKKTVAATIIVIVSLSWLAIMNMLTQPQKTNSLSQPIPDNIPPVSLNAGDIYQKIITAQNKPKRIIGYREEWVPGRPIEQCVGADKELNENVLRCRNGYKHKVPIYSE